MKSILPLSKWLSDVRANGHVVARRGDKNICLADLRRDVGMLHARLTKRSERRWALCFHDSYQFCVALLALLHAAKVPILLGHHRHAQLIEQREHFDAALSDISLDLPCAVWSLSDEGNVTPELPSVSDSAYLTLFTSGSTGEPRRIVKRVKAMDREAEWLAQLWGEQIDGCLIRASVSHQHLYGLTFRIWLGQALGIPFECEMVAFPEQLARNVVHNNQRSVFITSPAFLQRLDTQLPAPPTALVISAGGPLTQKAAQLVHRWLGVNVDEIYGSTETGVMAWRSRQTDAQWQRFPGVKFERDLQDNWCVMSPLIASPEGFMLDDRLIFAPDGTFQLDGRHDRVVKIEEKRISLSEIERRLAALDGIDQAVVLLVQRGTRQCIGVVLVLNSTGLHLLNQFGRGVQIRRWRQQLSDWLEPVAIPRYWRIVSEIPLNQQSKRSWPALQELFNETH
ncbi:AMP-binding protein [Ewingella sp. S1.OA.A_B6]